MGKKNLAHPKNIFCHFLSASESSPGTARRNRYTPIRLLRRDKKSRAFRTDGPVAGGTARRPCRRSRRDATETRVGTLKIRPVTNILTSYAVARPYPRAPSSYAARRRVHIRPDELRERSRLDDRGIERPICVRGRAGVALKSSRDKCYGYTVVVVSFDTFVRMPNYVPAGQKFFVFSRATRKFYFHVSRDFRDRRVPL